MPTEPPRREEALLSDLVVFQNSPPALRLGEQLLPPGPETGSLGHFLGHGVRKALELSPPLSFLRQLCPA